MAPKAKKPVSVHRSFWDSASVMLVRPWLAFTPGKKTHKCWISVKTKKARPGNRLWDQLLWHTYTHNYNILPNEKDFVRGGELMLIKTKWVMLIALFQSHIQLQQCIQETQRGIISLPRMVLHSHGEGGCVCTCVRRPGWICRGWPPGAWVTMGTAFSMRTE